nr:hypothetical protein [Tanacetum cinerariifolium]
MKDEELEDAMGKKGVVFTICGLRNSCATREGFVAVAVLRVFARTIALIK